MKTHRTLLLLVVSFLFLTRCSKDDTPSSYTDKIVLNNLEISGNSVKLSWTRLEKSDFLAYQIYRRDYKSDGSTYGSYPIGTITDAATTTFTDSDAPYTPYLEYQVIGYSGDPASQNPASYRSNVKSYERPEINIFTFDITDVIPDLENKLLYVFESDSGKISRLNFESGTIETAVNTNAEMGFPDLGTINGSKQLVVPRNDGWIFFYDATTLAKTDQINFGGKVTSVLQKDNKLFVCGESTTSWYYYSVKVYDCSTKNLISETNISDPVRLKYIPGTLTDFIGIADYSSEAYLLKFDGAGNNTSVFSDYLDQSMDESIVRVYPDGSHFITSREGVIISKDLTYTVTLPYGNYYFSDFAFSENSGLIYCACSNFRKVLVFANPGYSQVREYDLKCYPAKIFRNGNELICLSRTAPSSYYPYRSNYILEKIPLE